MRTYRRIAAIAATGIALAYSPWVLADDWVAERLRGSVLIFQDGNWIPLERGDVVSDDQYIKTLGNGRVQFTRGAESIDLAGHTMVQILDRNGERFTNVHQHYGEVAISAEKRDVTHFGVLTPYMAAIVKGTEFIVHSGSTGASVSVDRGQVSVADPDTGTSVDISPGQAASVDPAGHFSVSATDGTELPIIREPDIAENVADASKAGNNRGGSGNANNADGNGNGIGNGGNSANRGHSAESGQGNAGGNGGGGNSNGNGPPVHSNAGDNGGGPPVHSNAEGNGNGNAGGSGKGKNR